MTRRINSELPSCPPPMHPRGACACAAAFRGATSPPLSRWRTLCKRRDHMHARMLGSQRHGGAAWYAHAAAVCRWFVVECPGAEREYAIVLERHRALVLLFSCSFPNAESITEFTQSYFGLFWHYICRVLRFVPSLCHRHFLQPSPLFICSSSPSFRIVFFTAVKFQHYNSKQIAVLITGHSQQRNPPVKAQRCPKR